MTFVLKLSTVEMLTLGSANRYDFNISLREIAKVLYQAFSRVRSARRSAKRHKLRTDYYGSEESETGRGNF